MLFDRYTITFREKAPEYKTAKEKLHVEYQSPKYRLPALEGELRDLRRTGAKAKRNISRKGLKENRKRIQGRYPTQSARHRTAPITARSERFCGPSRWILHFAGCARRFRGPPRRTSHSSGSPSSTNEMSTSSPSGTDSSTNECLFSAGE